jgi:protein-S-isoprenylcysteine O-methyltransferase Ste14
MSDQAQSLPVDKPRTLMLPPAPSAAAIIGGWWLDRGVLALGLNLGQATRPLAVLLIAAGLVLTVRTFLEFSRHRTMVNPYAAATHLCTSGPFRYSRNPIYLGDWLILTGFSLWFATLWPILLSPVVWLMLLHWVIRREEEHLEAHFGQEYRNYKASVRRWI